MKGVEADLRDGFPRLLPPTVAVALDVHRQFRQFERLTAQAQREIHARQLSRLIVHARRYSPFWRDRLEVATNARAPGTFALSELPVLGRREVQDSFEQLRARAPSWKAGMVQQAKTSGSTGRPVCVERFQPLYWPIAWLTEVKPQYLYTAPTMAMRLAELALGRSAKHSLAQIITFGETVKPELRGLAQDAFSAKVTDTYSCEELGWIALQCPKHDHYHVMSSSVVVEIVDHAGRPCEAGQPGRMLLTGLHSFAMPLIRYEIGDHAEWGGPCDCGITLPVIARIWGRERSFIRLPDGSLRLARLTGEYWREIAPIHEYRVLQYADGLIEAFVTCERPLTEAERCAIVAMLQKVLGHPFEVLVTQPPRIDWGSRWKREDVVRVEHLREERVT